MWAWWGNCQGGIVEQSTDDTPIFTRFWRKHGDILRECFLPVVLYFIWGQRFWVVDDSGFDQNVEIVSSDIC